MWKLVRLFGGPETMMAPFGLTVFGWQRAQSGYVIPLWAAVLGGSP
jgi:hypothetical protein